METYFVFLLKSSIGIAAFYLVYLLFFRGDRGFRLVRFYFLTSLAFSLLLPLNRISIILPESPVKDQIIQQIQSQNTTEIHSANIIKEVQVQDEVRRPSQKISAADLLLNIYLAGLAFVFLRFIIGIINVFNLYLKSSKEKTGNVIVLKNKKIAHSFSFLNLIFINPSGLNEKELHSIIAHENIHVTQHHSIDLILTELLSAVMWFNPFVWMMRNSIRQVHEYLADEGVLETGFDRIEYQTLLINQVAESRLLGLASGFNHSQIKNRIIMMTKLKSRGHTKLKLLILLPVVALLFLMFSCINGNNKTETVTAVELSKMNVLYLGVGNPVTIAASGIDASELQVEIDNGTIEGSNGEYIIAPKEFKNATVKVSNKGKLIKELMFRVKTVPDPVPAVQIRGHSYIKGGEITKDELLNAEGVIVVLENFDFDLKFDIQEFSISKGDSNSPEISQTGKFSDTQKAIIRNTKKGGKIAFEDIKATGPDGRTRILSPMIFTIKE